MEEGIVVGFDPFVDCVIKNRMGLDVMDETGRRFAIIDSGERI
jgi:hypothetical protein